MKIRSIVGFVVILTLLTLPVILQTSISGRSQEALSSQPQEKKTAPLFKIRAITAFVTLDPHQIDVTVNDAVLFLESARKKFQRSGYEVQTIRLVTQPFPEYTEGLSHEQSLHLIQRLDSLAVEHGLDLSIGPGITADQNDPFAVNLITDILSHTKTTNTSVTVAGAEKGIYPKAIRATAQIMKTLSTASRGGIGNFSFAAAANCPPGIPFFPTAYHRGNNNQFALAIQTAGLVQEAFARSSSFEEARSNLRSILETQLQPVEFIAEGLTLYKNWSYAGMDVSTAPLKEVSIGTAIETLSHVPFGDHGTLSVAAVITDVLKSLRLKRTGYSGLMIPVMEDATISRRAAEGHITLDKLLLFSSACATGIDVAPLAGDTSVEQIEKIILDVATLSTKLHKPLAVRLLIVPGKRVGEMTAFNDPFLINTKILPLN